MVLKTRREVANKLRFYNETPADYMYAEKIHIYDTNTRLKQKCSRSD